MSLNNPQTLGSLHLELLVAAASSGKAQESDFLPSPTKTTLLLEDISPLDDYSKNARRVPVLF